MPALTPANRFVTLAECGATCTPGYWCTAASLSTVAHTCAPGSYSSAGATTCEPCPLGRYTDVAGTPTQCTLCPLGRYGAVTGLTVAMCSGLCSAGRYGGLAGESTAQCTGSCDAGRWGGLGETTSQCAGPCSAGYVQGRSARDTDSNLLAATCRQSMPHRRTADNYSDRLTAARVLWCAHTGLIGTTVPQGPHRRHRQCVPREQPVRQVLGPAHRRHHRPRPRSASVQLKV